MGERSTWHVRRSAPVRSDADSIFIASSDAPGAVIGDRIILEGEEDSVERVGVVVEQIDRDGESHFRLQMS
jgi:hypothetical protein